jgi:hypothetical protein
MLLSILADDGLATDVVPEKETHFDQSERLLILSSW